MFKKARLKLTAFYLAIIMTISLSFSAFIYQSVSSEFQRRLSIIETRLELQQRGFHLPPNRDSFFLEDLRLARRQVAFVLVYTNGVIFIFSAIAGYFLAGKTLSPIEAAMEDQKRFIADASHELKTPLTVLQTSTEVTLRTKKLSLSQAKHALRQNLEEIEKLKYLTNSLLSLTHYEQNGSHLTFQSTNLKSLVQKVIKQFTPLTQDKTIHLKTNLKPVTLAVHPESIEKALSILLDNALKYTPPKGTITVTLKKSKKSALISVSDTGIGISKHDLPHIFERFYRADTSRSKFSADGFGLGLSMAKRIVELHHGTIQTKSQPGRGATFTIRLPLNL